ncbi:MAG: response regulator [Candidatus Omnitrophica bacterium]|nr:response regulator [Candidatus Omnitrophota bacterium]
MPDSGKLKVLIVDDEDIVRDFLCRFLTLKGVHVDTVESGAKAIEKAQKEKFDVVLLDVRMPGMDGVETFKELKKICPQSKYVMMTGYAVDKQLEEAKKEGAFISVKKPFNIEQLDSMLDTYTQALDKRKMKVLVIDDEHIVLDFFKRLLRDLDLTLVSSGEEALIKVTEQDFDLVFMDITLRDTSAHLLYPKIQKIKPGLDIILITGNPDTAEGLMHLPNIKGCFYKPFEIDKVLGVIEERKHQKGI